MVKDAQVKIRMELQSIEVGWVLSLSNDLCSLTSP